MPAPGAAILDAPPPATPAPITQDEPAAQDAPDQGDAAAIDLAALGEYQNGAAALIAELEAGYLYSCVLQDKSSTCVYLQDADSARVIWEREGEWSLSAIDQTLTSPCVFFLAASEEEGYDKYTNALYCFVKETGNFALYYDKPCSNAASLSAPGYENLIFVLWGGYDAGDLLIPINVMDGSEELGQAVLIEDVSFFTGIGDWGTHLKCEISESGIPGVMRLTRVTYDEDSMDALTEIYTLDLTTGELMLEE